MLNTLTMNDRNIKVNGAAKSVADAPDLTLASVLDGLDRADPIRNQTLVYHLNQSDTMARVGVWDAATNEACSALNALVDAIVQDVFRALQQMEQPLAGTFKNRRRVLFDAGVIDQDDNEFLAIAFMVARRKTKLCAGVDEAWATSARQIVHASAGHLLARYAEWRKGRAGSV